MSVEYADLRRSKLGSGKRSIKLPGGSVRYGDTKPEDIADVLRKGSSLGRKEARLEAAEKASRK